MAQRIILFLLFLILAVWLTTFVAGAVALRQVLSASWPYDLVTLDQALSRSHGGAPSIQATQLEEAIERFNVPQIAPPTALDYTNFETSLPDDGTGGRRPGPITAATLQRPELQTIAGSIVSAGDRIVFGKGDTTKPTIHRRYAVSNFAQLLGAAALMRHNPNAWTDAQAMWIVARSLARPSDAYTKRLAMDLSRRVNAIVRKLPAPTPAWVAEVAATDPRRDLSIELQENAVAHENYLRQERFSPLGIVFHGVRDVVMASYARRNLRIAEAVASSPRCRVSPAALDPAMRVPSWNLMVRNSPHYDQLAYRADRNDAELEATQKILALKTARAQLGHWPEAMPGIEISRCSDNKWVYKVADDGSMSLKMSWEVGMEPGSSVAPALAFHYAP